MRKKNQRQIIKIIISGLTQTNRQTNEDKNWLHCQRGKEIIKRLWMKWISHVYVGAKKWLGICNKVKLCFCSWFLDR